MIQMPPCGLSAKPQIKQNREKIEIGGMRGTGSDREYPMKLRRRDPDSNVKRPEPPVRCARLVEAHLIDQLLEHQRIVGKKIDSPLPIVESHGTRDDLGDLAGKPPAHDPVIVHQPPPLLHRKPVPVVIPLALLVHRIEAQVTALRNSGVKARRDLLALPGKLLLDRLLPLWAAGTDSLLGKPRVERDGRFVQTDLDHGQVRSGGLEEIAQRELADRELRLAEFVEPAPKVQEEKITLVPEPGKYRA